MQRKYAHTGQLKARRAFLDNIQTSSIWDELFIFMFHIFNFNFTVATTQCVANW